MNKEYGKLTPEIIAELAGIAGLHNIITDTSDMEAYSRDETPHLERYLPGIVIKPEIAEAVAAVLACADKYRIPVTPRGAGTGLSGGAAPVFGGIVLSLEKMDRIINIDTGNFTATVEPGVPLEKLLAAVEDQGLYYPLYPGEMTATIGGTVATNAGGMNAVKYGVTRHNILGLEAALPNGEIVTTGGEYVKCSTGYDLTQLIAGSEGTLAVITKVILKLTTRPGRREVMFAPFPDLQSAIDAVPEILRLPKIPAGLEFMERNILEIVGKYLDREIPYPKENAFLMIIMDGETEDEIIDYFGAVEEICKRHGAVEATVPGSERARRRLLDTREKFYHALKRYAPMELIDTVVARNRIPEFVRQVREISERHAIPTIVYGHAGDGNVHLHPLCEGMDEETWRQKIPDMAREIYRAAVACGGAISGEHGIGIDKKPYLSIQMDEAKISLMREIKRAFDPNGILNPGKIFDPE